MLCKPSRELCKKAFGTRKTIEDCKTWPPQKDNRHQAGAWIKFYLFIR